MAEQLSMFEPSKRKSGLLYLPKYLTIGDQRDLLNDLRTVVRQAPLFTPTMSSGSPFRYKMTNIGDLGWVSDRKGYRYESRHPVTGQPYPEIPSSLRSMIADLSSKFGEQIRPDAVLLNWYPDGAKLGLHVDNTEKVSKPVVSLSLGDRGVFAIDTTGSRDRSTAMKNLERINVNSGDAIVFGGDLRNAYHAVERIDAGTAPPELGMKNSGRINLTARQVNKISGGGFGNPVAKFAKGFIMREGARLLAKQLGADEDQQQAVADTVTAANILGGVYQNATRQSGIYKPANPTVMQRQAERLQAKGYKDARLEGFDPMKGWIDDFKTYPSADFKADLPQYKETVNAATKKLLQSAERLGVTTVVAPFSERNFSDEVRKNALSSRAFSAAKNLEISNTEGGYKPYIYIDTVPEKQLSLWGTAPMPLGDRHRTFGLANTDLFAHELGHIVLGHVDPNRLDTPLHYLAKEIEADAVSYGVLKKIGLLDNPALKANALQSISSHLDIVLADPRSSLLVANQAVDPFLEISQKTRDRINNAVNQIIPESTESLKLVRGDRTQSMANKKINTGSVSSSVKEPKSPKLTTDTLYKYLQMMGGDPVIVKPDGSQYNPDRKGRVNVGDRMTTAEKFGQAADVGLNNEFTKLPEIHTRFDDPKIASMVAKELATGELTVGMQRNPETGEIETITKKFQPIPSRGNTQLRQYSLGNDPTGRYLAFNKPEEAYKAPPSLKELQADLRKSYKAFDLKPDATLREVAAAVQPRLNEVKNSPELRDRLQTVLSDIQNRTAPEQVSQQEARSRQFQLDSAYKELNVSPDMTKRDYLAAIKPRMAELEANEPLRQQAKLVLDDIVSRASAVPDFQSSQLTQYVKQAAIAPESQLKLNPTPINQVSEQTLDTPSDAWKFPQQNERRLPNFYPQTPRSKTQLALESDRIGGYQPKHIPKILEALNDEDTYRAVLGSMSLADQERFNSGLEALQSGEKFGNRDVLNTLNRARRNVPTLGGDMYDADARQAFSQLDDALDVKFGFNKTLKFGLNDFKYGNQANYRVDIPDQAKIELSRIKVDGKSAFRVDNIVAYNSEAVGDRFAMKTLKFLQENLPKPVVMGNVINEKFARIFEKQGYVRQGNDYLPPELAPQKQAIAQSPQQTLDTPSDAWKFPQQNERRLPNFYPQMASGENPLGTGATVQSTYDRAKSAYEGYQDFGYVPRDREFPTLREMKKLAESEGVKGDEAIKAYIKGKQNAPLIEAGVITPPELPLTARLGQEYISPKTGKVGTVESVGKKGVKLNVDGQAIPVEYQTLEKLKYTGNKDYGFVVPAALRPVFGGFAGGTLGAIAFKQLAKAAGLNEDQQNIAAGVGGVTGAITGGSLSLFKPTTELKAPTARQFAQSVMGIPAPSESGMFHSESGMVMMGDRPQTLSELQAARRELDAKYPDSPRYDRTAKPEPRKPVPFLTFDQAADQMSMSSSEYRAFQDRVYAEQKAVQSKPYQERQNQIAKQKFQQEQSYFDALKAWNKAGDPTIPMPRKEDFVSPIKNTFDFERTLSEASMAARSAESQAKGFGKPQPKSAIAQATQAIKNAGEIVLDALYQPSAANPSRASSPKQSNFIAESEVQKTAAAMGVSGARVRAEIASQRASGEAPNLSKATEAIATRTQPKELAPRSLKQMQQTAQQYTFNPPISEPVSTRAKTPTWELPAADFVPLPIPNKVDPRVASAKAIGDRVIQPFVSPIDGVAGRIGDRAIKTFGVSADVGQALEAFNRSASKGENASMAATRAAVSVGSFYGTSAAVEAGATALASRSAIAAKFLPPPVRLAAVLGLSIAASTGADKAISKIAGVDEQKQAKYGKDMLKLGLDVNPDSELYQPFGNAEPDQARDLSKVGEYARAYANSFVNTLAIVPQQAPALGRSLANLANSQSIENARYQSERQTSLQAGMDAKAKKSIAYEKRDDGTEVGYLRNRGYNATESRVLALQNLANEHGYEVPRTGKFEAKTLDALEKLGYSQSQISAYIQGKTDVIGKPNQVTPDKVAAVKVALARSRGEQVSSSELSAALSAERKAQGLKGGEMLNQGQVDRVFQSLAGRSLSQLRQSAKVGGNKTQSALRMGAGLR